MQSFIKCWAVIWRPRAEIFGETLATPGALFSVKFTLAGIIDCKNCILLQHCRCFDPGGVALAGAPLSKAGTRLDVNA